MLKIERKQWLYIGGREKTVKEASEQVKSKLWEYAADMHSVFGKKLLPKALDIMDSCVMCITSMHPDAKVDFYIDKSIENIYIVPSIEPDAEPSWDFGYFNISIIFGNMEFRHTAPEDIEQ